MCAARNASTTGPIASTASWCIIPHEIHASAYSAAQSQGSARDQLFERERGVCQACAFDAHSFYKRVRALPSEQARFQELMASPYSVDSGRLKRMLSDPKEGDFWEADRTYLSCFQLSEASCAAMRRRMIAVSLAAPAADL